MSSKGTFDLTSKQSKYAYWASTGKDCKGWDTCSFWPTTYYVSKGSGSTTTAGNYIRYQIRGSKGYKKDLSTGTEVEVTKFVWSSRTRTVTEELQNFANWFSYYRSRVLAARGGASNAFAQLGTNYRVGFATINGRGDKYTNYIPTTGVFEGSNRKKWFASLLETPLSANGTPLRPALKWAGIITPARKARTLAAQPEGELPAEFHDPDHRRLLQRHLARSATRTIPRGRP